MAVNDVVPVRSDRCGLDELFLAYHAGETGIAAGEFTPARAVEFLQWLRLVSSSRRAQLGVAFRGLLADLGEPCDPPGGEP